MQHGQCLLEGDHDDPKPDEIGLAGRPTLRFPAGSVEKTRQLSWCNEAGAAYKVCRLEGNTGSHPPCHAFESTRPMHSLCVCSFARRLASVENDRRSPKVGKRVLAAKAALSKVRNLPTVHVHLAGGKHTVHLVITIMSNENGMGKQHHVNTVPGKGSALGASAVRSSRRDSGVQG
ncbi:hypothetical protein VTK56DRAFT_155 [Thermocarpiscus australiensis]